MAKQEAEGNSPNKRSTFHIWASSKDQPLAKKKKGEGKT